MQDLKSAIPGYPNQCFNGVSSATSATQGTPFIIEMCSNTGNYAWQVTPTGTVTSATVNLMGSLDGVNWYQLDTMNQGDTAGAANGISYTGWNSTSGELRWVTSRPVIHLRIDPISVNGGGSVTGSFTIFDPNK